ncbi:phosphotransferase [Patulibacter minatonensis]|uniref:phosphotransferase n=1 Tax=Patulibacter minatonensis TaxID=298163 RepID=UPI00047D8D94|nr:phosphotransferase [Patulibacter minatonensis]
MSSTRRTAEAHAAAPERLDRTDQITAPWIASVLRGSELDAPVAAVDLEPFGDGKVSDTARVRITYAEPVAGAPDSLICKFHSTEPGAHGFAIAALLYLHELHSYREVGARGACRIPRAHLAEGDIDWINLVMDDLSATTDPGDQLGGCDLDQSHAVVREIAGLHAAFADLDPATAPSWLTRLSDSAAIWCGPTGLGAGLAARWFADRLPAASIALLERLPAATERFFAHPLDRLALTHGDVKADNVLFTRDEEPAGALILDWQNVGLRNPVFDLAYYLSGSVTVDDRRAHERELLAAYAELVGEHGGDHPLEAVEADYRVQLLSGAIQTAAAVAFVSAGGEQELAPGVHDFLATLLERNLTAVGDWDSIGAVGA